MAHSTVTEEVLLDISYQFKHSKNQIETVINSFAKNEISILNSNNVCRVAYALNKKKLRKRESLETIKSPSIQKSTDIWTGGGLADILTEDPDDIKISGVSFHQFDFDVPIIDQPFYHIIVHKLTEDIDSFHNSVDDNETNTSARQKLTILSDYVQKFSSESSFRRPVIVDPVESVWRVVRRDRTCRLLENAINLSDGLASFSQPRYAVLQESDEDISATIKAAGLDYPIICKPVQACGKVSSHSMVVVLEEEGLAATQLPCVAQQYHDHGGTFYKVYVIGDDVMVFKRRSLPDVTSLICPIHAPVSDIVSNSGSSSPNLVTSDNLKRPYRSFVSFDSRFTYPSVSDFLLSGEGNSAIPNKDTVGTKSDSDPTRENGHAKQTIFAFDDALPGHSSSAVSETSVGREEVLDTPSNNKHASNGHYFPSPHTPVASFPEPCPDNCPQVLCIPKGCPISKGRFLKTANVLKGTLGLSLFGFDVIIPNQQPESRRNISVEVVPELLVIDVNFFPSYKEVPDFPMRFRSFLRQRAGFNDWPFLSPEKLDVNI